MDKNKLERIGPLLLAWYDKSHRNLPWRENITAYRVWVSEIMLQQTRVEAVKPYFYRFMEAFPDVGALSEAKEEHLLKLWEGLGYYSRVRNMQKAAIQVVNKYHGELPNHFHELVKLPGIGSYTAGAIASIAYKEVVPAVDGNVLRIMSRLTMDDRDISLPIVKKQWEQELMPIIPSDRPGDFNQAMMELGATVCIPHGQAKCSECPWQEICLSKQNHCIDEYPKKTKKKQRVIEKKTVLILKDGDLVAIHKRASKGLLAGLYELPMYDGHLKKKEVVERLNSIGLQSIRIQELLPATHVFSHKEWNMIGYAVKIDELQKKANCQMDYLFIHPQETRERYPIPSAFAAYAKYLNIKLGNDKFL